MNCIDYEQLLKSMDKGMSSDIQGMTGMHHKTKIKKNVMVRKSFKSHISSKMLLCSDEERKKKKQLIRGTVKLFGMVHLKMENC